MRSKMASNNLPAMYNDLSQDNFFTSDTQSQDSNSKQLPVTQVSVAIPEIVEEALLEPPSTTEKVAILSAEEGVSPLRQKSDNTIGRF